MKECRRLVRPLVACLPALQAAVYRRVNNGTVQYYQIRASPAYYETAANCESFAKISIFIASFMLRVAVR